MNAAVAERLTAMKAKNVVMNRQAAEAKLSGHRPESPLLQRSLAPPPPPTPPPTHPSPPPPLATLARDSPQGSDMAQGGNNKIIIAGAAAAAAADPQYASAAWSVGIDCAREPQGQGWADTGIVGRAQSSTRRWRRSSRASRRSTTTSPPAARRGLPASCAGT